MSVAPGANVRQALNLMGTYNVSQIPVIEARECVGSLSEGPVMAAVADWINTGKAPDFINHERTHAVTE